MCGGYGEEVVGVGEGGGAVGAVWNIDLDWSNVYTISAIKQERKFGIYDA